MSLLVLGTTACVEHSVERRAFENVGFSEERLARIKPVMQRYVDERKLPGVVTVVARKGQIVHFEAVGDRDIERGEPMTPDTIFRIFSMTKPVVSIGVMMLWEQGLITLGDSISDYIPELSDLTVYVGDDGDSIVTEPAHRPIAIIDLLTHTSGFTYDFYTPHPVPLMYVRRGVLPGGDRLDPPGLIPIEGAKPVETLQTMVEALGEIPLLHQPGERWSYGVNTDILGYLIEKVTGQALPDFLRERIFEPLGMTDTAFYVPRDKLDRFAAAYVPDGGSGLALRDDPKTSRYREPPTLPSGGAGLVSTAADYYRVCQMLIDGGEMNGTRILGSKTVELISSNYLSDTTSLMEEYASESGVHATEGLGFGLGFAVVTDPAKLADAGAAGSYFWGGAASTEFWIDPETEIVAILMTQLIPSGTYPIPAQFKALVYQALTVSENED
jgi:CubicO group peptidase (beta-lactamase class C family)